MIRWAAAADDMPLRITVCSRLRGSAMRRNGMERFLLFETLAHEMGHVLNIRSHAEDPAALMSRGGHFL